MYATRYFPALMVGILVLSTLLFAGYVHAQSEPRKGVKKGSSLWLID